ncbi:hypothetical protein JXA02_03660 [candidate division KSB1 bacterium]|nr:hypothetical protein [candidate division KSB1 bacterium]RQW09418.1 MAG: hypothetical protein EH222_04095 [candidate division KSB1 bacterium]
MNDRQKTFIIIGLVLFLFVIAHHLLFVEKLKADMVQADFELRAEEYAEFVLPGAGEEVTSGTDISGLERKLQVNLVLRFVILLIGLTAFVTSYFCRERGKEAPFEDEWEEDDQEDDA